MLRDLAYGNDPRQKLDVYLPANAHDAPVIFMVHGGAWRIGDKSAAGVVQNKISRWLPKGFIVVSIDYPMLPQQDALGQADDVARALAFAQSRAKFWGGDPGKFIVMGHSAGAHLVALLAAAPANAFRFGAKPWLGTVSLDSAALDVVQIMSNRHLPFYDAAFGNDRARWHLASPIDALTHGAMPILAVCSLPRRDHSCEHAADFVAKAQALGVRSRVSRQDLSHEQINKELGLPGAYTGDVEAFMASLDPQVSALLGQPSPTE
jgi:acetyl esterase/lipase